MLAWGGLLSPGGSNFSVSPRVLHMDVISNFGTQKKIDCFLNMLFFFDFIYQMFKLGHFQFHEK